MKPAMRDTLWLALPLGVLHLVASGLLLAVLAFGGHGPTMDVVRFYGWKLLQLMHLPLLISDRLALFAVLPDMARFLAALVMVLVGSFGWGLLIAAGAVGVARVFPCGEKGS